MPPNEKYALSALDAYMNRMYKIIVILIPSFCLCASSSIIIFYALGIFPSLNFPLLLAFGASDLVYLAIGIFFAKTGFTTDGVVKASKLKQAKITMAVIITIQWNAISYIFPFRDFWAFAAFFVIIFVLFFDKKLVFWQTLAILASVVVSWFLNGDLLLPVRDEYFIANMLYRVINFVLLLGTINLITYLGGKCLVEELEKYANYDTLTRLLNRKSMNAYLDEAYSQACKNKADFCILMIDIDDFKKVNDTYGHDCGDEVLKYVATTVSCGVKKQDNVFRWGGEEILTLLRANKAQAMSAAERIRLSGNLRKVSVF